MTREQALRKVLACLRLSKSSNTNEAAAALRQARAMMEKYGLTEADAEASEIRSADAATRAQGAMLTRSIAALAGLVADGYRCQFVVRRARGIDRSFNVRGRTAVSFFGGGADPQIAAYAFTVLRRQLEADRARHTRRIRKRGNKEARGESFAIGWVTAVLQLFPRAEIAEDRTQAINRAIETKFGATELTSGREIAAPKRDKGNDHWAGYDAGKRAQLNQGITETGPRRLEQQ